MSMSRFSQHPAPQHRARRVRSAGLAALALLTALAGSARAESPSWAGYAGNAQHVARAATPSQPLRQIVWQTPVDLFPPYSGNDLLIHYGSPLVGRGNTVVVPVKRGVADSFRVEGRRGSDGVLLWAFDSDYRLPPQSWIPSYSPTLTPAGVLYAPAAGATLLRLPDVSIPGAGPPTRVAFYGLPAFLADTTTFSNSLRICTP